MNFPVLLFDIAPVATGVGIFAGAAFFLIFAAVAFVAFKMLKRTAKLAVRMAVAGLILLVALIGTIFIWVGSASVSRPSRPPARQGR